MKYIVLYLSLVVAPWPLLAQSPGLTSAVEALQKEAQTAADAETKSLANDFGSKTLALSKSLEGNPGAQKQLETAVGNKGPAAIDGLQKLASAKFTPEQSRLAKDVYNVGSAYVVKGILARSKVRRPK